MERPIQITTREQRRDSICGLFERAERHISVLLPKLDGYTFNSANITEQLTKFIQKHLNNRVQILVENDKQVIQYNERLIQLTRRFSSYIGFRRLRKDRDNPIVGFIVVDETHYLYQRDYSNPESVMAFDSRKEARVYQKQFDAMWNIEPPMPGLHTLGL